MVDARAVKGSQAGGDFAAMRDLSGTSEGEGRMARYKFHKHFDYGLLRAIDHKG